MKQKPPLQITIFLLLLLFVMGGNLLDKNSLPLRQDITSSKLSNDIESQQIRDDTALAAINKENKNAVNLHGKITNVSNEQITLSSSRNPLALESNTYVSRNGMDVPVTSLEKNDTIWAATASKNGTTLLRITALSQTVVYGLFGLALLASGTLLFLVMRFIRRNTRAIKHKFLPHRSITFLHS